MKIIGIKIAKYYKLLLLFPVFVAVFFLNTSRVSEVNHSKKIMHLEGYQDIKLENFSLLDSLDILELAKGAQEMQKHKLVIAGITRDNAKDLPVMIRHLEYIGGLFEDYRIILFENDSIDGTKDLLNEWKNKNEKVNVISQDYNNKKRPHHQFMAEARNNYLRALSEKKYDEFDILMVVDMDAAYGIDIRAIQDSFSKINKWDAVCSNGVTSGNLMYDSFAFRDEKFPFTPKQWHEVCSKDNISDEWSKLCQEGKKYSRGYVLDNLSFRGGWQKRDRLYWLLIMPQIRQIFPVNSELLEVDSCFGGMAFYKKKFIKDCWYISNDNDCEHVAFHQCIKDNKGKMFLNPAQIIRYSQYTE